jgi:glucose-6-phosphate-specific signal transduction histidine kinase
MIFTLGLLIVAMPSIDPEFALIHINTSHGTVLAEISNDDHPRRESTTVKWGSGLSGLAERVANEGGQLEARTQSLPDGPGFRLKVEIPIRSGSTMEAR